MNTNPWTLRHSAPTLLALACIAALGSGCGSVVIVAPGDPGRDGGAAPDAFHATDAPIARDAPINPPDADIVRTCRSASDCAAGEACTGPEGCGVPWTCSPALGRPCTDDIVAYCGCDGATYTGSSTCPTRPYAFRGSCNEPMIDAGPTGCVLPNGIPCPPGVRCPLDPCTVCLCGPEGSLNCLNVCGGDGGGPPPPPTPCRTSADCAGGSCVVSAPGCGVPGLCAPGPVPCTADLVEFCGCDGRTFRNSSSCPGQVYAHRGACGTVDAGPAGCSIRGVFCPYNTECAIDRCTVCRCSPDGSASCGSVPNCGLVDAGTTSTCRSDADCPGGSCRVTAEGCGVPGTCTTTPLSCTDDLVAYCGCDGVTFYSSSACPGRVYARRGVCTGVVDAGVIDAGVRDAGVSCAPQDARGVGPCAAFFGYAWNGLSCEGLGGCSCAGADCARLYRDPDACRADHARCPIPI